MSVADVASRPTILVVDDQPQNLSLMSGLLEESYNVKLAPSGARALSIAAATPPDLILLDIMMPEMDGYEVCTRLKADPVCKDIPVVFVTALADQDNKTKGLSLGAVDYLTKPVNPEALSACLTKYLS